MWLSRAVTVIALLLLACAATYALHDRIYRRVIRRGVERGLATWYDGGPEGRHDRNRVAELRQKLGVNIDSLPPVRLGAKDSRVDSPSNDDHDDEDNDDAEARDRRHRCLTIGEYVSSVYDYVNCRSYCRVADGVEYRYFDRAGLLIDGRRGRVGSYCLPTRAAMCNTNTSIVVYTGSKDNWKCLPQTRAFAGEGGNRIVVCDGSLLDRATGIVWREFIDPTLQFSSIDERLPNDGGYRFVCPASRDRLGNTRVESPMDRLLHFDNYCAALIPFAAADIRPDFRTGRCICSDSTREDPVGKMCAPYEAEFNGNTYETTLRAEHCIEMWSVRSVYDVETFRRTIPCGVEHGTGANVSYPSCVRLKAFVFDRPIPSAYAMMQSREN